jgi:hypothetical protein
MSSSVSGLKDQTSRTIVTNHHKQSRNGNNKGNTDSNTSTYAKTSGTIGETITDPESIQANQNGMTSSNEYYEVQNSGSQLPRQNLEAGQSGGVMVGGGKLNKLDGTCVRLGKKKSLAAKPKDGFRNQWAETINRSC